MADARHGTERDRARRNAVLGWGIATVLTVLAINHALTGSYRWFVFTGFAVLIVVAPAVAFRDPLVLPPWELFLLILIPVVDATLFGESILASVTVYVAVAAVALVVAVEIHRFTTVRMSHSFAVSLVVLTTLAVAGAWNAVQWVSDVTLGTQYILEGRSQNAANRAMMFDFAYAAIAGLLAGIVFDWYFRSHTEQISERTGVPEQTAPDSEPNPVPSLIRDRLNAPDWVVSSLSRVLQAALVVLLLYGLVSRNLTTIANATIALAITVFPAILERDYRLPIEPGLVFWLTAAVFLHALGSAGLYDLVGSWDSITHTISASIVAAAGYAVVRAIDLHTDDVYLPPKMLFAFILVFVLAFGVVWELIEFAIDETAQRFGIEAVVAQYGIGDTVVDLAFDLVGAVIAAIWGSFYLTDLSQRITDRFGE